MYIIIKVKEEMVRNFHKRSHSTPELKELIKLEKEFNVVIKPIQEYSDDSLLDSYFIVHVPEHASAEEILSQLRKCKIIEAAYIKPPDEMP